MKNIYLINEGNLNSSYDLGDILEGSVFYPAAGKDARDIVCLTGISNSFVHVDYSYSREILETAMREEFVPVGYKPIGIKSLTMKDLAPNGFRPLEIPLNLHERRRLEMDFIRVRYQARNFTPFALWAVYELDDKLTTSTEGKAERFSLLHIGGEACATFEAVYISNRINPRAVTILCPGEGFGDNWTLFRNPDFRLFKYLKYNRDHYNQDMPEFLLTYVDLDNIPFWPGYRFVRRFVQQGCNLYALDRN